MTYFDSENKCHDTNPDGIYQEFYNPFFDGKCSAFISGYKFLPSGKIAVLPDGTAFDDGMISPWKPYSELEAAQREYEKQKLSNCLEALQELGVET